MKRVDKIIFLTLILGSVCLSAFADDDAAEELSDAYTRENPTIDSTAENLLDSLDLSKYPFLNLSANKINVNGAAWSRVPDAFADCDNRPVRIVHIGDSHIQADMSTGYARRLFQQQYGVAGRGLIVPLKLASTNEPRDYAITSTSEFEAEKLLNRNWSRRMGFTGVSLSPKTSSFDFSIRAADDFERIYIYYNGAPVSVTSVEYNGAPLFCPTSDEPDCLEIGLPFPCDEITVNLTSFGPVNIYGMELISDVVGVTYSAIGINGATYSCYNRVPDFGRSIAALEPDLIIISLGTNEAFGKVDPSEITSQIDALVSDLTKQNPDVGLMLVTPAECHQRIRRKRRTSFAVNKRIAEVRKIILEYASRHSIPVYDWYEVAGGDGSSADWIDAGLFSADHIHYSRQGYELGGRLLFEAINNSIENYLSK